MEGIDDTDMKILGILSKDGRAPFSQISKVVRISDVAVKKRYERLIQRGIIKGIRAVVDYRALGFPHTVFVMLRADPSKVESVMRKVYAVPEVVEVHMVIGEANLLVKFLAPDIKRAREIVERLGKVEGVLEIKSMISMENMEKNPQILDKMLQKRLVR